MSVKNMEAIYKEMVFYVQSIHSLMGKQSATVFHEDIQDIKRFIGIRGTPHPLMLCNEEFILGPLGLTEEYQLLRCAFFDIVLQRVIPELHVFMLTTKRLLEENNKIKKEIKRSLKRLLVSYFDVIVFNFNKRCIKNNISSISQRLLKHLGADAALEWFQDAILVWCQIKSKKEDVKVVLND